MILQPAPWGERAICQEIYSILQHIATSPLSKGHDGAVQEAGERLKQATEQLTCLRRRLLNDSHLSLLNVLIGQVGRIPLEVVARTLIGPLGDLLSRRNGHGEYPCCFVAEPSNLDIQ